MGKKKIGRKQTSKGGLGGKLVAGKVARTGLEHHADQMRAYKSGRKVMITIPNPNIIEKGAEGGPLNTNKRFIRVPMSSLYPNPKTGKKPERVPVK